MSVTYSLEKKGRETPKLKNADMNSVLEWMNRGNGHSINASNVAAEVAVPDPSGVLALLADGKYIRRDDDEDEDYDDDYD